MGKLIDMTGQKVGKLTVIERCGSTKNKKALWLCKCECGGVIKVTTGDLRRIVTVSQNNMNKTPLNYKKNNGVSYHIRDGKWQAYISKDYQNIYIGLFNSEEEAIKARKQAEEKYFGEYSYDNSMKLSEENSKGENKNGI